MPNQLVSLSGFSGSSATKVYTSIPTLFLRMSLTEIDVEEQSDCSMLAVLDPETGKERRERDRADI